jgi:ABC-type phosphate transport system substrate-binding protein
MASRRNQLEDNQLNGRLRSLTAYTFKPSILLLSAATILAVAAQVCIAALRLTGAGATFPYPIYSKWFDEYHKLHPDIEVNYQSIGSVAESDR